MYVVWLLFALTAVAVFATYWRIPVNELWKVSQSGLAGGAGRAFVFLSYSAALAAIAIVAIVADRLEDRRATALGTAAVVLCATVAIPGVQTKNDLDAKWANLPAVLGVALAVGLTAWAAAKGRPERVVTSAAGDVARLVAGCVALVFAAPYIAAELGFFLDGVPLLGWIFQTGRTITSPPPPHPAVHHGIHHGWQGLLLILTGLLLTRLPLNRRVTPFFALLIAYGFGDILNDGSTEQIVERGWASSPFPDVLRPALNWGWAAVLAGAAVIWLVWLRRPNER